MARSAQCIRQRHRHRLRREFTGLYASMAGTRLAFLPRMIASGRNHALSSASDRKNDRTMLTNGESPIKPLARRRIKASEIPPYHVSSLGKITPCGTAAYSAGPRQQQAKW
jgi:hypothetical protein